MFGQISIGFQLMLGALVVGVPLIFGLLIFWMRMIVDAIENKNFTDSQRVSWVLILIFLNVFGAFVYHFFGRTKS